MLPVGDGQGRSVPQGAGPTIGELNRRLDRLYDAMERDDAEALRRYAAEHPGSLGWFLREAVLYGTPRFVAALIRLGVPIDHPDECASTPLMYAAGTNLEMVRHLVEAGADPNAVPEDFDPEIAPSRLGRPALFRALVADRRDVADYLAPLTRPDLRAAAYDALWRWYADRDETLPF